MSSRLTMSTTNYIVNPGMSSFRSPTVPQASFTFTTPTQCSTLGTHRPCIQTTSPMKLNNPGVGASWQHSIPTTMPWVDRKPVIQPRKSNGTATVFTGLPYNHVIGHPSHTEIPRRSKRRSQEYFQSDTPPSKVHRCADQFASMSISSSHGQDNPRMNQQSAWSCDDSSGTGFGNSNNFTRAEQWERFREIEDRLVHEFPDSDTVFEDAETNCDNLVVKVAEDALSDVTKGSPILPRSVMEDITKPCMQLVIWQSPESLVLHKASEEKDCQSSAIPADMSTLPSLPTPCPNTSLANSNHASSQNRNVLPPPGQCLQWSNSSLSSLPQDLFNQSLNSSSCSFSSSPGFLKPLSSASDSSSSSSYPTPSMPSRHMSISNNNLNGIGVQTMNQTFGNSDVYANNNSLSSNYNNNNINTNSNMVDMFDSLDDDMQL